CAPCRSTRNGLRLPGRRQTTGATRRRLPGDRCQWLDHVPRRCADRRTSRPYRALTMSSIDVTAPLAGIRVLDLTTFLSGPYACHILSQLGAQIVKVEPPTGDATRAGEVVPNSDFWWALHRGRRSVMLDLKDPAARDVFVDL